MTNLFALPDMSRDVPDTLTPPPVLPIEWVDIGRLRVNRSYQRGLGEKNLRSIRKIIRSFSWVRFGVISGAVSDDGIEIIDGQHRAIAAKALGIKSVPVVMTEKVDDAEAAQHFVGMNTDRNNVTASARFIARLAAGDKTAQAINTLALKCGVEVLARAPQNGNPYQVGQTTAITVLEKIYGLDGGPDKLERVLTILVAAKKAPLRAADMRMLKGLMQDEIYDESYTDAQLITALSTFTPSHFNTLAAEHRENTGDSLAQSKTLILWKIATGEYLKDQAGQS